MSAKAIFVFCAQALLFKSVLGSCIVTVTRPVSSVLAYEEIAAPMAYEGLAGWDGRELAYGGVDVLPGPLAADGLTGWGGRELAYDSLPAPVYEGLAWTGRRLAPTLDYTPTSGGALPVSSISGTAPVGISVLSENAYDGILEVVGELPFVSTVGIEGLDLPTLGAGAVNHACGNGDNSMVSEDAVFSPEYFGASIAPAAAIAPGLGCRAGWPGRRIGNTL